METIISLDTIQCAAVDAADAGKPALSACPWPPHSAAANEFKAAYDQRVEQLSTMTEA